MFFLFFTWHREDGQRACCKHPVCPNTTSFTLKVSNNQGQLTMNVSPTSKLDKDRRQRHWCTDRKNKKYSICSSQVGSVCPKGNIYNRIDKGFPLKPTARCDRNDHRNKTIQSCSNSIQPWQAITGINNIRITEEAV